MNLNSKQHKYRQGAGYVNAGENEPGQCTYTHSLNL